MNWLLDHAWAWHSVLVLLVLVQVGLGFLVAKSIHGMRKNKQADHEASLEGDRIDAAYERGREEGWSR